MTAIQILMPLSIAAAVISCSPQKANEYDTTAPYGPADSGQANPPATAPANPVYDTPAAYDASTTTPAAPEPTATTTPAAPKTSTAPAAAQQKTPAHNPNGPAIIHVVVKGDTLSGIGAKYKVPVASIKQANRMTNDTVVLGRKMVIPPQ